MKDRTKNCFKKLADITGQKCAGCPSMAEKDGTPFSEHEKKFRCCDKLFCSKVKSDLTQMGIMIAEPNVGGIPFMGEKGCVVPAHLRPYCSGFVCHPHFKDREFRREYDRLINKITTDPEAPAMPEIMKYLISRRD
jgi:hypothetical protein